jgi:hypothetical protein
MQTMIHYKRLGISICEAYFCEPAQEKTKSFDLLRIVGVLSPNEEGPWNQASTLVIDLTKTESQLLEQLDSSTRYEVRRAQNKDNFATQCIRLPGDAQVSAFAGFYDNFARYKDFRPIFRPRLYMLAQQGMLVLSNVSLQNNDMAVWHAYVLAENRAILLYSASSLNVEMTSQIRTLIGRANRLLHWNDLLFFKKNGCSLYDFGGIDVIGRSPETSRIAQFKQGFGGTIVPTYSQTIPVSWKGRAVVSVLRLFGKTY